jgi:hypothetical protein
MKLKGMNFNGQLTLEDINQEEHSMIAYYYASELGIFNMRNSKFKQAHNVIEHLIILSYDDLSQSPYIRAAIGYFFDIDAILVN